MKKLTILALGTLLTLTACGSGANPSLQPSVNPSVNPSVEPSVNPSTDPSVTPSVDPSTDPSVDPSVDPSEAPKESDVIINAMGTVRESAQSTISQLDAFNLNIGASGAYDVYAYNVTTTTPVDGSDPTSETHPIEREHLDVEDFSLGFYTEDAFSVTKPSDVKAALGLESHANGSFEYYNYTVSPTSEEPSVARQLEFEEDGSAILYAQNGNIYASFDQDLINSAKRIISSIVAPMGYQFDLDAIIPENGKVYLPLDDIGFMAGVSELSTMDISKYINLVKDYVIPEFEKQEDITNYVVLAENLFGQYDYEIGDFLEYSFTSDENYNFIASFAFGPKQYRALMGSELASLLTYFVPENVLAALASADLDITLKVNKEGFVSNLDVNVRSFSIHGVRQHRTVTDIVNPDTGETIAHYQEETFMDLDLANVSLDLEFTYGKSQDVFPTSYEEYELLDVSKLGGMQSGQKEPTPAPTMEPVGE